MNSKILAIKDKLENLSEELNNAYAEFNDSKYFPVQAGVEFEAFDLQLIELNRVIEKVDEAYEEMVKYIREYQ